MTIEHRIDPTVCAPNDVVQVMYCGNRNLFNQGNTFRVADLLQKVRASVVQQRSSMTSEEAEMLFIDGLECELLRPDARGWHRGKVKITMKLEFYSDPSEEISDAAPDSYSITDSNLDGIRQLIGEQPDLS